MGTINLGRVVGGGLVAGLILNVVDFVMNGMVLASQWNAAMAALGKAEMGGSAIAWFVVCDFLIGLGMVWVYAAIRPRFGAGARTGVIAGLTAWFLFPLPYTVFTIPLALYPTGLLLTNLVVMLVALPACAVAGAAVYQEGGAAPAAAM